MGERMDYLSSRDMYNRCADDGLPSKLQGDEPVPENTRRNNLWAINTWNSWCQTRQTKGPNQGTLETWRPGIDLETIQGYHGTKGHQGTFHMDQPMPTASQLASLSPRELNTVLCRFVYEVRRYDGSEYPPNSLYQLCCGLVRFLKNDCSRSDLNFLDTSDPAFHGFQQCLNTEMKRLTEKGVGAVKRKVRKVTEEQEQVLWKLGLLGSKDPWTLVKTIYYYNCKLFSIYGRDDHRALDAGQFVFGRDGLGEYVELRSTRSPNGKRNSCRPGRIYEEDTADSLYKLYKLYLGLIPRSGPLYRKPSPSGDRPSELSFSQWPIGVNSLCAFVPNIMKEAGFEGFYTGHSIKVTIFW